VAGLLLPRREDIRSARSGSIAAGHRLVRTLTVQRTLHAAALAICQQQPLLLQGPPGEICKPVTTRRRSSTATWRSTHDKLQSTTVAYSNAECLARLAGCGKTTIINELAAATGNTNMVRITLDDQMDAKSLLGAYVCTATPGEFVWQPGPLTQVRRQSIMLTAATPGKWQREAAVLSVLLRS
jgi:midasin